MAKELGELESDAIDAAYQDRLNHLFQVLCTTLTGADPKGGEKTSVDQFTRGLTLFRKARELALKAASRE